MNIPLAVLIFFLLSGNLITRSIKANIERKGEFDALDYAASRIARVYPPLIGSIIVVGAIAWLIHAFDLPGAVSYGISGDLYQARDRFEFSTSDILRALLMLNGLIAANGPLWTLYIEFKIYVIAMGVAMLWRPTSGLVRAAGIAIVLAAIAYTAYQVGRPQNFPFFVVVWAIGSVAAFIAIEKLISLKLMALITLIVVVLGSSEPRLVSLLADTFPGMILQIACCLVYARLLFTSPSPQPVTETNGPVHRFRAVMIHTGDFSYSLYILHFPILLFILSLTQNWIQHSLLRTFIVCLVVALPIVLFADLFARVAEKTAFFKSALLKSIKLIRT